MSPERRCFSLSSVSARGYSSVVHHQCCCLHSHPIPALVCALLWPFHSLQMHRTSVSMSMSTMLMVGSMSSPLDRIPGSQPSGSTISGVEFGRSKKGRRRRGKGGGGGVMEWKRPKFPLCLAFQFLACSIFYQRPKHMCHRTPLSSMTYFKRTNTQSTINRIHPVYVA